jgi:hypothetical protein
MLGAYQPSPNAITLVIQALDSLTDAFYRVLSSRPERSKPGFGVATMKVEYEWLKKNLQPMVDFLVEDYNRKYPFRRMRRIQTFVELRDAEYAAAYNPMKHTISFALHPDPFVTGMVYNNSERISTNPILFTAKRAATDIVSLIVHEFLHSTQAMLHLAENPNYNYAALEESLRYVGPTYHTKKGEIASYAINLALRMAVFTPRRIYRDHDLKRLLAFDILSSSNLSIDYFEQWVLLAMNLGLDVNNLYDNAIDDELLGNFPEDEDTVLWFLYRKSLQTESPFDKNEENKFNRLERNFLLKNRGAALVRDEFKRPRDNRVSRPAFEKFKKGMKAYIDLQIRNVRRRIINFDPVNQHYGLVNQTLYKPDYYGLKL